MNTTNSRLALAALLVVLLSSGCATQQKTPREVTVMTPPPSAPAPARENPGSLFAQGQADNLFADSRARRVGDVVTVRVNDVSKGKHKADTTAQRESDVNIGVSSFFGKNNVRATPLFVPSFGMGGAVGNDPIVRAGSANDLTGKGETKRESDLSASVGARVVQILPNGLMQVEGAREMRINEETQILVVRGLVRPQDIDVDNSVTTDKLADATIEFYGQGVLADKQRPGWMARILDNVWPF